MEKIFPGVFRVKVEGRDEIATKGLVPGKVYGEHLVGEYRVWNPNRSKLAAYIIQGGKQFPFKKDSKVLYLGAGNGTTVSHISDMVSEGVVYCIEFAPRSMRDLMEVCGKRDNMVPILADANFPENYPDFVGECDIVYQDVAQPNQGAIFVLNCERFLKKGGHGFLMIKTQSIDVTLAPKKIVEKIVSALPYKILEQVDLGNYQKDHTAIVISAESS